MYCNDLQINLTGTTGNFISGSQYDSAGRLRNQAFGNGVTQTRNYNAWNTSGGRLVNMTAGTLQNLSYTYDSVGNIQNITDSLAGPQVQSFAYETLDRLTSADAVGGINGLYAETYGYDANTGNMVSKAGVNYTYGDTSHAHAVTSLSNGNTYSYDANGNQITRVIGADTYSLSYDAENRLTTVLKNGQPLANFSYDGDGKQVAATVNGVQTKYVNGVYEVEGTNVTKYYMAGMNRIAMRVNGVLNYLLQDHLGSTALVTDNLGNVVLEQRYKAWGETRYSSSTANTYYLYTGQREVADIGLYFYKARWYDPYITQMTQPDSIIPDPYNPLDWNRYTYARNNSVKYTDPSGHCPVCIVAVLVIGAILLTGDTSTLPPAPAADGNASIFGDLLQLGIEHATSANIVGRGLQDLQNDPHVKGAQDDIIEVIKSNPNYGKEAFYDPIEGPEGFTANGPDENWVTGALTGNPSFWMVHTANLYATNTHVSADGTISTTWKVEDQFDYLPAWGDHFRTGASYWAYNGFAQLIAPIYHGLLQAEPLPTNACWNQTIPPENKYTPE